MNQKMSQTKPIGRRSFGDGTMSRRGTLKGLRLSLLALAIMGCSPFRTKNPPDSKPTYLSPQDLAVIFQDYGIEPIIQDNNGNRTLLQIGELHYPENGDKYVEFFDNLEGKVFFDKVFMEGVYSFHRNPDPRTAFFRDDAISVGDEFSDEDYREIREKDSEGYFRLSRKYNVMGIEPDNHDFHILFRMFVISGVKLYPLTLSGPYEGKKNPKAEAEINELASRLKVAKFPARTFPEKASLEEKRKIWKELSDECFRIVLPIRNQYFSDFIDNNLEPYEMGALIIGKAHTFEGENHEPLQRYFAEKRIDVVLLSIEQVVEFNRQCLWASTSGRGH